MSLCSFHTSNGSHLPPPSHRKYSTKTSPQNRQILLWEEGKMYKVIFTLIVYKYFCWIL